MAPVVEDRVYGLLEHIDTNFVRSRKKEFGDKGGNLWKCRYGATLGDVNGSMGVDDNHSYYHYELQQSFYKYILENEYGMKISSMILCVLHPEYSRYYTIKLSDYRKDEVEEMIAAHISMYN